METVTLADLVRLQAEDGSFPSYVVGATRTRTDWNGFTTAIIWRTLRDLPPSPTLTRLRDGILDFLEGCRSTRLSGAFGFWPEAMRPAWASQLPPDLDDTALMTLALLRAGRLDFGQARWAFCTRILPYRTDRNQAGLGLLPDWIVPGAFKTWIAPRQRANVVDCCVNAHVITLMTVLNLTHLPGFAEAIATIERAVVWAGNDPVRLTAITPFYPALLSLAEAVEYAIECGVTDLQSTYRVLHQHLRSGAISRAEGCCCSAYGGTVWHCESVTLARALRAQHRCPSHEID